MSAAQLVTVKDAIAILKKNVFNMEDLQSQTLKLISYILDNHSDFLQLFKLYLDSRLLSCAGFVGACFVFDFCIYSIFFTMANP